MDLWCHVTARKGCGVEPRGQVHIFHVSKFLEQISAPRKLEREKWDVLTYWEAFE